ncbi:MAG: hypothetical protein RI894_15 [Bacteroidota bacterium]
MKINEIHIKNFKSIRDTTIKLASINVLIGANGAGKSNFISYFKFLKSLINGNLQGYTADKGPPDNILHFGLKESDSLFTSITFQHGTNTNTYECLLKPTNEDGFYFEEEYVYYNQYPNRISYQKGYSETKIEQRIAADKQEKGYDGIAFHVKNAFNKFSIYHFHDTSETAAVKRLGDQDNAAILLEDAGNLAAFLYEMRENDLFHYKQIVGIIRLIAPYFHDFDLEPRKGKIQLRWKEKTAEKSFNAHHLSDGTLRMMCLCTLLLQKNPPPIIIIDEPELGLHPAAITRFAAIVKTAARKSQIIIATQSTTLINHFAAEDIIVAERKDNQSVYTRLNPESLTEWLKDYSIGEIWEKNIIGGRP